MAEWEGYPLHECVFKDDLRQLSQLLRVHDVSQKDVHGNTPLHLAVMLGHKECIQLLLAHGAPVRVKNQQGWTPLAESISYGDRQTILCLLRKLKAQSRESLEERRPALIQALKDIGDFYLELKWDFHSWVPLVSRILPSDVCKIHKKGCRLRLDTTLVDFNDMHWERGDITFIFDGDAKPQQCLSVLDNRLKVFQRIRYEESEAELDDEVDILMSSDIMAAQMSTKNITFSRAQSGWLFREDKTEMVGEFEADFFYVNGLTLESKKRLTVLANCKPLYLLGNDDFEKRLKDKSDIRTKFIDGIKREHLSPEDVQKNKAMMESLSKGTWDNCDFVRRPSLIPPPEPGIEWENYLNSTTGKPPCLGRHLISKESTKSFKATIAMSKDFPMCVKDLLDVLEVVAPFKQFQKLRQFMTTKLPDGFPVKIEIPVFPTVTAKVTFNMFEWLDDISEELFFIPKDYTEDPNRFPDL